MALRLDIFLCWVIAILLFSSVYMDFLPSRQDRNPKENRSKTELYLELYGYLDRFSRHHSRSRRQEAIRSFQRFNKLRETGKLNKKTRKKMMEPRCSVPDRQIEDKGGRRIRRYSGPRKKWNQVIVTWGIHIFSNQFRPIVQWKTFRRAFKVWGKYAPLLFLYRRVKPDIEIKFVRGEHGDGWYNAFDGKGMTLAHAFRPNSGDTHFDEDEEWILRKRSDSGVNLLAVAIHEFGHAIGMEHLSNQEAIMFPYFKSIRTELHRDDRHQLEALYGKRGRYKVIPRHKDRRRNTTPRVINATGVLNGCQGISDMFVGNDGYAHVLAKTTLFKVKESGKKLDSPIRIRSQYYKAPTHVDAATSVPRNNLIFLFKGSRVWKVKNNVVEIGFPKVVKMYSRERPKAAVTVQTKKSTRVFIFGTRLFWEWSSHAEMMSRMTLPISKYWRGVPNAPDAALQWRDGYLYFIKGEKYFKVHPRYRRVMRGYPKQMPAPWLRGLC